MGLVGEAPLGIRQVGETTARLLARTYGSFDAWRKAMEHASLERHDNAAERKNPDLIGDAVDYMVENCLVEVTFIEGNPAVVELPSSVVLTVTDAPEGVKGDSTTNVMKTITLETGKKIQAPLFIKNGERLKVDTREGKYMERVNK